MKEDNRVNSLIIAFGREPIGVFTKLCELIASKVSVDADVLKTAVVQIYNELSDSGLDDVELLETCDCSEPFPKNGICDFCGARARYLT